MLTEGARKSFADFQNVAMQDLTPFLYLKIMLQFGNACCKPSPLLRSAVPLKCRESKYKQRDSRYQNLFQTTILLSRSFQFGRRVTAPLSPHRASFFHQFKTGGAILHNAPSIVAHRPQIATAQRITSSTGDTKVAEDDSLKASSQINPAA